MCASKVFLLRCRLNAVVKQRVSGSSVRNALGNAASREGSMVTIKSLEGPLSEGSSGSTEPRSIRWLDPSDVSKCMDSGIEALRPPPLLTRQFAWIRIVRFVSSTPTMRSMSANAKATWERGWYAGSSAFVRMVALRMRNCDDDEDERRNTPAPPSGPASRCWMIYCRSRSRHFAERVEKEGHTEFSMWTPSLA